MFTPQTEMALSFKENSLLNSQSDQPLKFQMKQELLSKLKFLFNRDSFKFFIGYSEEIFQSEILPNYIEDSFSPHLLNSLVFDIKKQCSKITKDMDRMHNQENFKSKRNLLKKELQKLISRGLIEIVKKDVVQSKNYLMNHQASFSNETLNLLLQVVKNVEQRKMKLNSVAPSNSTLIQNTKNIQSKFDMRPSFIQSEKLNNKHLNLKTDDLIGKKLNFNKARDLRKESQFHEKDNSFLPDQSNRSPMSKSFKTTIIPNQVVSDFALKKINEIKLEKNPMTPFNSK